MNLVRISAAVLPVFFLVSCAYPVKSSTQTNEASLVSFIGDFEDEVVILDGVNVGLAKQFDGEVGALEVLSGPHKIQVELHEVVLFSKSVFVGPGQRLEIQVSEGGEQ